MTIKTNDLTIYDKAADRWWSDDIRWVRTLKNMVPARLKYFDEFIEWKGANVLDVGCGGGFMAEALARRDAKVTGIDPAAKAIGAAVTHAQYSCLNISYNVGNGENLPFADEAFDVVVCVDVLEHVLDLNKLLAQVARVLCPGGVFVFDTINRNLLASLVIVKLAEKVLKLLPHGTHDPTMFIRPEELRKSLANVMLHAGPFVGLGPTGINRRGDLTFGRWPGTAVSYLGMAQKQEIARVC